MLHLSLGYIVIEGVPSSIYVQATPLSSIVEP